ncbi:MAG: hypothetical protein CGW95_07600 [Phenylobacterium zucineum]|nr:MAG: hypothetical protein CGW95_07600 [Phenylobacterium zucineum]
MSTTRAALTDEDVRMLVKGATPDERALAAHKVCRYVDRNALTAEDRAIAEEILRVLAQDATEMVRRALAVTLKASPMIPRDVALRLARDVESIALPLLSTSPVFTDQDLMEIIRLGDPVRQMVIAKRPKVSRAVSATLVEYGGEQAVEAVCANDHAEIAESTLQNVLARFEDSERVLAAVAYRQVLPLSVTEKLINMVGDSVRDHLLNHHEVSAELALEIALGAKERATIDLVDQAGRSGDVRGFVAHLHKNDRLTASLLLRALAHGHMSFFEWGLSELSTIPHHRTWMMVHDAGPLGLRAIYERTGLPARLFPAFRVAVDTFHSMEFDGGTKDRERFQETMLQRFLTQPVHVAKEDVEYLLDKMDRLATETRSEKRPALAV